MVLASIHSHDEVMKWKHVPCYWPFVRGIHRGPVDSPHQGPVRRSLDVFFDLRRNKGPVTLKVLPFDDVIMKQKSVEQSTNNNLYKYVIVDQTRRPQTGYISRNNFKEFQNSFVNSLLCPVGISYYRGPVRQWSAAFKCSIKAVLPIVAESG